MNKLDIGEIKLPYRIDWRKNRSSVGFGIDQDMELVVRAPRSLSIEKVERAIQKKKGWLLEKIEKLQEQKQPPLDKDFLSGEKLTYKGRNYRLKVFIKNNLGEPRLEFQQGKFLLFQKNHESEKIRQENAKELIEKWYRAKADKELRSRTETYSKKMNLNPGDVEIKDLNKKWGRAKESKIELHWRLITAPPKIQDYIIVHELTHLKEDNHTENFWNTVGTFIPDYEDRIEWLRINGNQVKI
ncbi:MAG: M48 family metallopeptidase [Elusimicrobiota bacterium]